METESSPKIIGVKNGIQQVEIDRSLFPNVKDYDNLYSFFSSTNYWQNEKAIPDFPIHVYATTLKGAKLTDFIQFGQYLITCPFIIHKRVADILAKFNCQPYYLYKAEIYDSNKALLSDEYFLMCSPLLEYDIVNFPESVFFTGDRILGKQSQYFENKTDYINFTKTKTPFVGIEKMMLSKDFDFSLDFFYGRLGRMYVSEALKDAIEILGFTGVRIKEPKEPEIIMPT